MSIIATARRRFALPAPTLNLATNRKAAVLKLAANGVEYRAMLELDGRNCAAPAEIAAMLERMAGYIRRDAR
jgi:hypothetical protein